MSQINGNNVTVPNAHAKVPPLRLIVTLNKIQQVPGLMTLVKLIKEPQSVYPIPFSSSGSARDVVQQMQNGAAHKSLVVHALQLVEVSERTSTVMMATEHEEMIRNDAVVVFRTFGQLNGIGIKSHMSVCQSTDNAANRWHSLQKKLSLTL